MEDEKLKAAAEAEATKLKALKAEHGAVATVKLGTDTLYFRKPSLPEYHAMQDRMSADKDKSNFPALREISMRCSVGDDPKSAFEAYPAAVANIGLALLDMAGSEVEVLISKA